MESSLDNSCGVMKERVWKIIPRETGFDQNRPRKSSANVASENDKEKGTHSGQRLAWARTHEGKTVGAHLSSVLAYRRQTCFAMFLSRVIGDKLLRNETYILLEKQESNIKEF